MSGNTIKLLTSVHVEKSMAIIRNVVVAMKEQNIDQWDDEYPTTDIICNDIENGHAFGYFVDGDLCAYIVLNDEYALEYNSLDWKTSGKPLIVHRLCVDPSKQGRGIAKQCIKFAESYAKENGFNSIRLDAFRHNLAALSVYNGLDYTEIGIISLRKGQFYCFEKGIV